MDLLQKRPELYKRALRTECLSVQIQDQGGSLLADIPSERNGGNTGLLIKNLEESHAVKMILKQDGSAVAFSVSNDDIEIADLAVAAGDELMILMLAD